MKDFEQNLEISITGNPLNSLAQSHNIDFYDCPLTRAHITKINNQIKTNPNTRKEVYGAVFTHYMKTFLQKYCECNSWFVSDEITYNSNTKSYSFNIWHKLNHGYRIPDSIQKFSTFCKIIITFTISINGNNIKVVTNDSYEFDKNALTAFEKKSLNPTTIFRDIQVVSVSKSAFPFLWDSSNEPISFFFEASVLKIASNYCNQITLNFLDIINKLQHYITSLHILNGNFLNALHFCYPHYYYTAHSYQIISAVWRKAIIAFPLFKKASIEKQIELLEKAFKNVKHEIGSESIESSEYAQALYYHIIDNTLDVILSIPSGNNSQHYPPKKKVREKWGRKHSYSFYKTKIPPSELVWVQYGTLDSPTTYLVGDIWNMIDSSFTPNSPFNIDFNFDCIIKP